jgi:hypothetical protein
MNWRRGFNRLALVFGAIGVAGGFYVGTLQDEVIADEQARTIREWKQVEIRLNPEVIAKVREALIKANLDPDNPGQWLKPPAPKPVQPGSLEEIFRPSPQMIADDLRRRRDQIESQIIEPLVPPLTESPRDLARWLEILKLTAILGLVGWLPFRVIGWIGAGFSR